MLGPAEPLEGFPGFIYSWPVGCISGLLYLALIVLYINHIRRHNTASATARVLWGAGIIFLPFVAMPAYYLLYVLRDQPSA